MLAGLTFFNKVDPYMQIEVEESQGVFYLYLDYSQYNVNKIALSYLEDKGWIVGFNKAAYPLLIKGV